jgi:PhnB protein
VSPFEEQKATLNTRAALFRLRNATANYEKDQIGFFDCTDSRRCVRLGSTQEEKCMASDPGSSLRCAITPWLSVRNGAKALDFYKRAFGAIEDYRLDVPDGTVVAQLSVDGAEFWLSDESPEHGNSSPEPTAGAPVRMILTVADPDAVFRQAVSAGAVEVYPVSEGHGWRVGRIVDPFGHHWEIGRQLVAK